ncbi:MAG: hybrid sensor histidine kinase/response regulator [Gammaproteobacteria bacterium]|nr:MAG: hybrid sensor histidine kinase/response regulator [Gammaproteobacteria bacterium]
MPNFYLDALILNVDDNDGARYAKTRILTLAGFKVIEANCGAEALSKTRSYSPNLILLDVKLPDINGLEVCRQIKEDENTKHILILQTSASFIGSADKIRALDGGADNYLVEPIEPDELLANVKALLRLGRLERELRDVDRRKDEFLATLAHELRNPLGPIKNSVELWRRLEPTLQPPLESIRNTIARHSNHLAHLVDDLLDVSRISKGKISLRWEKVELKNFINSAVEQSAQAIENRKHTLNINLPQKNIWVAGDQVRLSQIVVNLLLNAAKFTEPGGNIDLSAEEIDDSVVIRLKDNGIGIADNKINSIFELFEQSGHVTDRVQDGLGIGLSLVRALVRLHGGEVHAESNGIGQGSIFEIKLPIETESLDIPTEEPAPTEETMKRILIVDDNEDGAITLAQLLELKGHDVQTAFTGASAVENASQFNPDIIFLDIGLPDFSGYEVAKRLRALPQGKVFSLIALTGYGQAHDRQTALDSGFDDHFVKPIDFKKLEAMGILI